MAARFNSANVQRRSRPASANATAPGWAAAMDCHRVSIGDAGKKQGKKEADSFCAAWVRRK